MSFVGKKCSRGYELQVCRSAAGYYLGTLDEYGCPNCRVSEYAPTKESAMELRPDRDAIEISYCSGGSCI